MKKLSGGIFNNIFSINSVNRTSYKFGFMKSLFENIYNVDINGYIDLREIFKSFTQVYWPLYVKYKLIQRDGGVKGCKTSTENIFDEHLKKYNYLNYSIYENKNIRIKYVVGAIYYDSGELMYNYSLRCN